MNKENIEEIEKRLKEDPFVNIDGEDKKERVHVNVKSIIKDALTNYIVKNKNELNNLGITSRNKLIALILEEWYEKNKLNI